MVSLDFPPTTVVTCTYLGRQVRYPTFLSRLPTVIVGCQGGGGAQFQPQALRVHGHVREHQVSLLSESNDAHVIPTPHCHNALGRHIAKSRQVNYELEPYTDPNGRLAHITILPQ